MDFSRVGQDVYDDVKIRILYLIFLYIFMYYICLELYLFLNTLGFMEARMRGDSYFNVFERRNMVI